MTSKPTAPNTNDSVRTISVFGLGYVGCVSAACFAKEGFTVIGVDVSETKVATVNRGEATIVEEGISDLVREHVHAGRLSARTDVASAIHESQVSLVCVGTPSRENGSLDLSYVERVCEDIGGAMASKSEPHIVVLRSTVLPGTIHDVVIPALERSSGKKAGTGFHVCSNPEFLREGSSIKDFYNPPFTLIGADDPLAAAAVASLYRDVPGQVHVVPIREAEMVKYACNCFHGVKVGFANEIGAICKALGVDSHGVMRIFCEDTKLNISPAYLRPGFAFGGSCLPKDLRAVSYRARQLDVDVPILSGTLQSNERHIDRAFRLITQKGTRRIALLGLAFKAGTDDLRESPLVTLVERLIGKGAQITIFDRDVSRARIMGTNREYIEREIPHIWELMRGSIEETVTDAECVVIGNGSAEFLEVLPRLRPEQRVVDLVGAMRDSPMRSEYAGIAW